MTLTFAGALDHAAVVRTVDDLTDLVSTARVATAWERESALSGMTVGGLARHLASQPECAVEFLRAETPAVARPVSVLDYYGRVDWLDAATEEPENTSIRDHFNSLAGEGPQACLDVLARARAALPGALAEAPPATYVPWQDCSLHVDDFLVCRLVEIVVHADDLAVSVDCPTPVFDDAVWHPALGLLAALSARRHGQHAVVRALARAERSTGSVSAF